MIEEVINVLRANVDELADEHLCSTTPLVEGGYIDSFDIISLISALEQVFAVTISLESLNLGDFETPEKIARFVERTQTA